MNIAALANLIEAAVRLQTILSKGGCYLVAYDGDIFLEDADGNGLRLAIECDGTVEVLDR